MLLPPLLTVVILLWAGRAIQAYVWNPTISAVRTATAWAVADVRTTLPDAAPTDDAGVFASGERLYRRLADHSFVPLDVYETVAAAEVESPPPRTWSELYQRYVGIVYLNPLWTAPLFCVALAAGMYLLGRFLAAGFGRFAWEQGERLVERLPLVRNVYGSVKQVTDFMLSQTEMQFKNVVAVQYPSEGIWSLAFVTGDGMRQVREAAGDPLVAILVPNAPIPLTGYTMMIRRSEIVDINLSIDEACQFMISCGVVVPRRTQAA